MFIEQDNLCKIKNIRREEIPYNEFIYNGPHLTLWSKPPKTLLWHGEHPAVSSSLRKSHPSPQPGRDHCSEVVSQWHGKALLAHCLQPLFLIITGKLSVYNLRIGDTVVREHTLYKNKTMPHGARRETVASSTPSRVLPCVPSPTPGSHAGPKGLWLKLNHCTFLPNLQEQNMI